MEHSHGGLEDHFFFLNGWFVGSMLIFQGCSDHASVLGVSWVGLVFQKSRTKLRTAKEPFVGDWVEKASNIKFNCVFVGDWNLNLPYLSWCYIVLLVLPKTPTQRGSLRTFPGPYQSNLWRWQRIGVAFCVKKVYFEISRSWRRIRRKNTRKEAEKRWRPTTTLKNRSSWEGCTITRFGSQEVDQNMDRIWQKEFCLTEWTQGRDQSHVMVDTCRQTLRRFAFEKALDFDYKIHWLHLILILPICVKRFHLWVLRGWSRWQDSFQTSWFCMKMTRACWKVLCVCCVSFFKQIAAHTWMHRWCIRFCSGRQEIRCP